MRCLSCNKILTDNEAVRKTADGEFLDLCSNCTITEDTQDDQDDDRTLKDYLNEIDKFRRNKNRLS